MFVISILNTVNNYFEFPNGKKLNIKLKDVLENNVDDKYYLSKKAIKFFTENEIKQRNNGNFFKFNVTDGNGIAKTITTRSGYRMDDNFIIQPSCIQIGELDIKGMDCNKRIYSCNGLSPTLTCMQGGNTQPKIITDDIYSSNYRIRRLTPKECWRLMGFDDEDFENAQKFNSDTQLYKQSGNSIVVNVLEAIFKNLILNEQYIIKTNKLF